MEILWDDLYDQKTKEISDLTQDIEKLLSLIHIPKPEEQNHLTHQTFHLTSTVTKK